MHMHSVELFGFVNMFILKSFFSLTPDIVLFQVDCVDVGNSNEIYVSRTSSETRL